MDTLGLTDGNQMHPALTTVAALLVRRRPASYELDNLGGARVVNHESGYAWARGAAGYWRQLVPAIPSAGTEVARLIAHPDTTGEQVASVLRRTPLPWITTLRRAAALAEREMGVAHARAREMADLVHAVMASSENEAHHLVLFTDDPQALACAYRADADLEPAPLVAKSLRHTADVVGARGPAFELIPPACRRLDLVHVLVQLQARTLPGQRYGLEPVSAYPLPG